MTTLSALRDQVLGDLVQHADPVCRELVRSRYDADVSNSLGVRTPIIHRGFRSEIDRYPAHKDTLIVLSNREDVNLPDITALISQMILENE